MKDFVRRFFGLAFLFFFISTIFFDAHRPIRPQLPEGEASEGTEEDPFARVNWEIMRTRNPRTGTVPNGIRSRELSFAKAQKERLSKAGYYASSQEWIRRGPYNVGGRTRALAVDVSDESTILAGGVSGGMWRSTDGGLTWKKTTAPDELHSVSTIAQDTRPGKEHIWYYGTGETSGNSAGESGAPFRGDGLFKSIDRGLTWTKLSNTSSGTPQDFDQSFDYVQNLAADASNLIQDELYAATRGGIYKSVDGGNSWKLTLGGTLSEDVSLFTEVAITSDGVVYATLSDHDPDESPPFRGIWRSVDGKTWTDIKPADWPIRFNRNMIGIAPSNENLVYFIAYTPGSGKINSNDRGYSLWKYVYVNGDGSGSGGEWNNLTDNLPEGFDGQGSYDLAIAVKPDDENFVILGGRGLYRSTDGFSSLNEDALIGGFGENHHVDQHKVVFLTSDPLKLLSAHDGGVSRTNNVLAKDISWQSLNNGYTTSQFHTITIDRHVENNNTIMGGLQDNGTFRSKSAEETSPWVRVGGADGGFGAFANDNWIYYTSWQRGRVFRKLGNSSTGGSDDWTRVDPQHATGQLFINPFVLDPNNTDIMYYVAGEYIWRNNELDEIPLFNDEPTVIGWSILDNAKVVNNRISAIEVTVNSPGHRLYYGTSRGKVFALSNANIGNPNKIDIWTDKGFPVDAFVSSIAVNPDDGFEVLLIFSNYEVPSVFHTTDGGESWTDVSGSLEEFPDGAGNGPSVRWGEILPYDGGTTYYLGTSTGLYSSKSMQNSSTVWVQEGESTIGNVVINMIDSRSTDGMVAVATHGNGIYSNKIFTENAIEPPAVTVPESFSMDQNFPNPFNPTTMIKYDLPKNAEVSLRIYNTLGQLIKTLHDGAQVGGTYFFQWDGRNTTGNRVASGVYIARLTTISGSERKVMTRKMTLIK